MSLLGARPGPSSHFAPETSPNDVGEMLSSSKQERPRKRQHSRSEGSNPAEKRTRVDWPFASSPYADPDSISKATSIHQYPEGVVPRAIRPLSNLTQLPGDSFFQSFEHLEQPPRFYPSATDWTLIPQQDIHQFVENFETLSGNDHTLAHTNMYGRETFCAPDSCFGFTLTPRQWVTGFASLAPSGRELTNQVSQSDEYPYVLEKSETDINASEKPILLPHSTGKCVFQPYHDDPAHYARSSVAEDLADHFFTNGDIASVPACQTSKDGILVETRQPFANPPHMTYSINSASQIGHSWTDDYEKYQDEPVEDFENDNVDRDENRNSEIDPASETIRHAGIGPSRRRPFQNPQDRQETAQTRIYRACVRCRMQKVRCHPDPFNPGGACITCRNVLSLRVPNLGCLRYKVTDIRLFKSGQVPERTWTKRWPDQKLKDISDWASPEKRKIRTTEGYTPISLEFEVRRFIPKEGDMLERHWLTATREKKSVTVPPFAISNISAARKAYHDYINNHGSTFIKGCLKGKDELIKKTYSAAFDAANSPNTPEDEATLLKMVLRLWTAVRITTRSIRICGEDTLDMPHDILDETSPLHGKIPVPPVLGAQIELILIENIQKPLRREVLQKLQKLISANKTNTWFTLYLCTFILLHNCSLITKYDAGYAKKHMLHNKYARPSMVKECHTGANVLLAYWHYRNKGFKPFTADNNAADFHAMSELKHYQTEFVKETSRYVQANATSWKSLEQKQAYEHDFYFVSQLYEPEWCPRSSTIV